MTKNECRYEAVGRSITKVEIQFEDSQIDYGWGKPVSEILKSVYRPEELEVLVFSCSSIYDGYDFCQASRIDGIDKIVKDFLIFRDKQHMVVRSSFNKRMKPRTKDYVWTTPLLALQETYRNNLRIHVEGYNPERMKEMVEVIKEEMVYGDKSLAIGNEVNQGLR